MGIRPGDGGQGSHYNMLTTLTLTHHEWQMLVSYTAPQTPLSWPPLHGCAGRQGTHRAIGMTFPNGPLPSGPRRPQSLVLLPGEARQVFLDYLGPQLGSSFSPR